MENFWLSVLFFLITLAAAVGGSFLAVKIKMPAGTMLGAMIGVAIFNIFSGKGFFPEELRTVVQVFSGAMIGSKVSKKDVVELKYIIVPTIILLLFMTLMNVSLGLTIYKVGSLDIATALFASSPGGLSDMALLSEELGANSTYVTLLQLIRVLTIFSFMPAIVKRVISKKNRKQAKEIREQIEQEHAQSKQEAMESHKELSRKQQMLRFLGTMLAAFAGGLLFHFLGVTAGAMLGSMLATALYNILSGKGYFASNMRSYTQIGSGAFLGMKIDMASILGLTSLIVPALIMVAGVLFFALMTALIMHKLTKLDFSVCLMASTPGGIQEMSLLSEELGADTPKIAVMQTARLVFVIALFPTMIELIANSLG